MFCTSCGAEIPEGTRYCAGCGSPADAAASPLTRSRPGVVTALAVLKIVGAAFWLGVTALFLVASTADEGGAVFTVLAALSLAVSIACAACAYGLWTLKSYGRVIQIVLSFIGIILHFPVGSVISILILVYLFTPGIRILFSERAPESLSTEEAGLLRASQKLGKTTAIVVAAVLAVLIVPMTGIIAAIAIPNLLNAIDRGKQKRTMADVVSIATAMDAYADDHEGYPVADSAGSLAGHLAPKYLKVMPLVDGWSHPFQINSADSSYTIFSFGKDGVGSSCEEAETTRYNDEICFADGRFVRYPAGLRR